MRTFLFYRMIVFLFVVFLPNISGATESEEATVIVAEAYLESRPTKVYFVSYNYLETSFSLSSGFLVPIRQKEPASLYRAVMPIKNTSKEGTLLQFGALFLENDKFIGHAKSFMLSQDDFSIYHLAHISKNLKKKKESLKRLNLQIEEKEKALKRLKADLAIIGNFQKATEVERKAQMAEQQIKLVESQKAMLEQFLHEAKKKVPEAQFELRKQELSTILVDLRKEVQKLEEQQGSKSNTQFLHELSLIEQTRDLDLEELRSQLIELRKKRQVKEGFKSF